MATPAKRYPAPRCQPSGFRKLSTQGRRPLLKPRETKKLAKGIELSPKGACFFTPEKKKSSATLEKGELETGGAGLEDKELAGRSKANALRRSILEEAMNSLPAHGAGRVMYIVKTFDWLQSIPTEAEEEEEKRKVKNWALPGLEFRPKAKLSDLSPLPVSCSAEWIAEERGSAEDSLVKNKDKRASSGTHESGEGQRSNQNSKALSKRSRNTRPKVESPPPSKLRTRYNVSNCKSFLEQIKMEKERHLKMKDDNEARRHPKVFVPGALKL
ncbi:hypothetical protein ZIOFF_047269 [Zingiber officinale]|uniref:Uncharacterized protein n=1 Tax=Zingiber officinale TaxID=94328 RepID=A0A8J5FSV3_ZINOF|nr:hypothetical protein ZIOFF_047269 [Zingiber officinale]